MPLAKKYLMFLFSVSVFGQVSVPLTDKEAAVAQKINRDYAKAQDAAADAKRHAETYRIKLENAHPGFVFDAQSNALIPESVAKQKQLKTQSMFPEPGSFVGPRAPVPNAMPTIPNGGPALVKPPTN